MALDMELVKKLREQTGISILECKKAVEECGGDLTKAAEILRKKGFEKAKAKSSRVTNQGAVGSYIHMKGKIGVLVELGCETDFVAKNEDFLQLIKDIAMQIAAMSPTWVAKTDVPDDVLACQKETFREQALSEGKPEKIIEKIVDGKMAKFYEATCLLEQPFIKDDTKTVGTLVKEMIATVGENISVRRFVRYEMGEGLQKKEDNFVQEVLRQIK
jgi:elongation factor Ts